VEVKDGPWILEGTSILTNERGSWEGAFRLRHVDGTTTEGFETVFEFVGHGAYEGLRYVGTGRGTGDPTGSGHTSVFTGTIERIEPWLGAEGSWTVQVVGRDPGVSGVAADH